MIEKYWPFLLMKCGYIVKEVEQVIRDIGRSLVALSLTNTEVLSIISDQVNRLLSKMQRVNFEASQSQLDMVDKLSHGIKYSTRLLRTICLRDSKGSWGASGAFRDPQRDSQH